MREIKFRLWDGKKMHNWHDSLHSIYCYGSVQLRNMAIKFPGKDGSVLMQFTGLHDKAGKEIYEGDVIRYLGYEVRNGNQIRPERLRVIGKTKDPFRNSFIDDCFHLQNLIEHGTHEIEVIGNIYSNPELLNKTPPEGQSDG